MQKQDTEAWKQLLSQFYDFSTNTPIIHPHDAPPDNPISLPLLLCARLHQTGHKKAAAKLWHQLIETDTPLAPEAPTTKQCRQQATVASEPPHTPLQVTLSSTEPDEVDTKFNLPHT